MGNERSTGESALKVLQITDCHLKDDPHGKLLGVNTRESLDAVIQHIQQSGIQPDLILATGDLAQDGSEGAYRYFQQTLSDFNCPCYWLPGNHDNRQTMDRVAGQNRALTRIIDAGNWRIIMLDSQVKGKVHGFLADQQLDVLQQGLADAESGGKHVLVCCHHHPVKVNSHWLDKIGLQNHQELLGILKQYQSTKAMLWGHVHQEFEALKDNIHFFASPSTCIQFKRLSHGFAVEALQPGYRWLNLYEDGQIDSEVQRTQGYEFSLDLQSNGY